MAADIAKHVIRCSQNCKIAHQGEEPLSLKARATDFHHEFFLSSAKYLPSSASSDIHRTCFINGNKH